MRMTFLSQQVSQPADEITSSKNTPYASFAEKKGRNKRLKATYSVVGDPQIFFLFSTLKRAEVLFWTNSDHWNIA